MTTQPSSQPQLSWYYFVSAGPARHCHGIIFFGQTWLDLMVLFFGRCHCIIFRGSHTKGKHSVQLIFVGILVPGRLGHVIVLFFFGRASRALSLYYFFSQAPAGQCHGIIFIWPGPAGMAHGIIFIWPPKNKIIP